MINKPKNMSKVKEIENAVKNLPEYELRKFRAWFTSFDSKIWDKKFENDVAAGKIDELADEALDDYKRGNYREI